MRTKPTSLLIIFLLIAISVTSITGCSSNNKFSKYGFSFEYPEGFKIAEAGLFNPDANWESGIVEVRSKTAPYKSFQVTWYQRPIENYESPDALNNDLDAIFTGIESSNLTDVERGRIIETTLNEDSMLYQSYTITPIKDQPIYGIQAVHYCPTSEKGFALKSFNTIFATDTALVEDFMSFANTFICHQ